MNFSKVQAMGWFRLAAQQGHPKSSYNLAIGHLSGLKANLEVEYSYIDGWKGNLICKSINVTLFANINLKHVIA